MYELGDLVMMKKPHACQTNNWEVMRVGMDIRLKCMGCGHMLMMPRRDFEKKMKKVVTKADSVDQSQYPNYAKPLVPKMNKL